MVGALHGYMGHLLRVDLSQSTLEDQDLEVSDVRAFLGGTGLGAITLYREVPPDVMPFDPANRLILFSGPFSGTAAPGSGTYSVVTRGPLTGLSAASQANGFFGARLRQAGFDGIVVEGEAREPMVLLIHNGEACLRPAANLWGKDTFETEYALKEEIGAEKASVACIGPAGENRVWFAGIFNDHGHVASSNGVGAVMGAKRLKAIAAWGDRHPPVHDESAFREAAREWMRSARESNYGSFVSLAGTAGYFSPIAMQGWLPVKNLTESIFPQHPEFSGLSLRKRWELVKNRPCHGCPLRHCRTVRVTSGTFQGLTCEEPEYEALAAWGSNVGIADPGVAAKLSETADQLGFDLKEGGFAISLAMECFEKGLLSKADVDGLELTWGNWQAVETLQHKIAKREGCGSMFADGVMKAAQLIGGEAPQYAVYVKEGIAPHMHDPRGVWSLLFGQSVSNTGAIEASASLEFASDPGLGFDKPIPPFSAEFVPMAASKTHPKQQLIDSLGVCQMVCDVDLQIIARCLSRLVGWEYQPDELLRVGERAINTLRAFNVKCGLTPEKEGFSPRLAEPPSGGPAAGVSMAASHSDMLRAYYRAMGWDTRTGRPLPMTLRRLGLDEIADDFEDSDASASRAGSNT